MILRLTCCPVFLPCVLLLSTSVRLRCSVFVVSLPIFFFACLAAALVVLLLCHPSCAASAHQIVFIYSLQCISLLWGCLLLSCLAVFCSARYCCPNCYATMLCCPSLLFSCFALSCSPPRCPHCPALLPFPGALPCCRDLPPKLASCLVALPCCLAVLLAALRSCCRWC